METKIKDEFNEKNEEMNRQIVKIQSDYTREFKQANILQEKRLTGIYESLETMQSKGKLGVAGPVTSNQSKQVDFPRWLEETYIHKV